MHPADHAGECTGCGDPIESLLAICVTHPKLAGTLLALVCPVCKAVARLNSLSAETEGGERSDGLLRALKTCVMCLISLDGKISKKEQKWINENFGERVSDIMIQTISVIDFDWDKHFKILKAQLSALSDVDKEYMLSSAKPLFLELLSLDDPTNIEFERLQDLMDFIGENLADR